MDVMTAEKPAIVALSEATKIKNQLRDLANRAGETAYKRLGLAAQLLTDKSWIAADFGGDQHKALATIEEDFFGDLCGAMPLTKLLKLRADVAEADWKKCRWNLQRVAAEWADGRRKGNPEGAGETAEPRQGPVPVAEHRKMVEEAEHYRSIAKKLESDTKSKDQRIEKLERELAEKNTKIAMLEGRLMELEKLVHRSNS